MSSATRGNVAVVVLGDLARSPRMQFHVKSLVEHNYHVDFIGLGTSELPSFIEDTDMVSVHRLKPAFSGPIKSKFLFPILAFLKFMFSFLSLVSCLLFSTNVSISHIVVQNPPSLPTLMAVWMAAKVKGAKIVIDWHNLGYTLLGLRRGENALSVRIYRWLEREFGRGGDIHLCVSLTFKQWLLEEWKIDAHVLYDRPPAHYTQAEPLIKQTFLQKMEFAQPTRQIDGIETKFTFAAFRKGREPLVTFKRDRPALIVAASSWTEDENMDRLFEAAKLLKTHFEGVRATATATAITPAEEPGADTAVPASAPTQGFTSAVIVISGKGPLKKEGKEIIESLNAELAPLVSIHTVFVRMEDYPVMLSCADIGLSMHGSSSGLDLPMKVLDCFGVGLPVVAASFPALPELVTPDLGLTFSTSQGLFEALRELIVSPARLRSFRGAVRRKFSLETERWEAYWDDVVLPLIVTEDDIDLDGCEDEEDEEELLGEICSASESEEEDEDEAADVADQLD
eukprot:gnl/Dysnectes_brevis/2052_a2369_1933.p1 GENE.gnl/Dysnectes_brevis/2052_a2369_1933~~gnl/Dysnectes_brevis/2052_a2369_1933.p1  ORF type:complete len:511 (+),score=114.04 gnl/Dysnectes_brevis/2052_a2369_1933:76-1608(+)